MMHGIWGWTAGRIGEQVRGPACGRKAVASVAFAVAIVAGILASASPALAVGGPSCVVVGVEDAATLQLQCGGEQRTLRLASIRAPRPGNALGGGEPYGTQGRELVRGWFVGRRGEGGGGRARLGGGGVRRGLLALGLVEGPGSGVTAVDALLRAAEREARLASRGLWSYNAWRQHQSTVRETLQIGR